MASTNKTTNYELSQYIGSDKPTYLGDYNSDMLKIDNAIHQNALNIATADEKATLAGQNANTALTNASNAQTTADTANSTATTALSKATANETSISALETANTYTTSETVIGSYNNKPLYRQTIVDTLSTTNGAWKNISIENATDVEDVINLHGTVYVYGNRLNPVPYTRIADNSFANREYVLCNFTKVDNCIAVNAYHPNDYANALSGKKIIIVIEYTKTTD